MKGLEGKVAIVTGGASGIGAGLVRAFVAQKVKVAFCDIQVEQGRDLARELGSDCIFQPADIRKDEEVAVLVAAAAKRFGGIDFLINAAATYADHGAEADRAEWLNGFDTNLVSHVILMRAALEHLKASPAPCIVNFTSEAAHVGLSGRWVYPATKAAIEQFTRSAALDLAPFNIRVNAVLPSWTEKPWHASAPQEVRDHYNAMADRLHMIGRMGKLSEVADAVLFLCSGHASFVTGSCLRVDGGHSALGPQGKDKHLPTERRKAAGVAFQAGVE